MTPGYFKAIHEEGQLKALATLAAASCSPTRAPDLTKDGVPINPKDWTVEDWRDLHEGINSIKEKISARHRVAGNTKLSNP